jgi:hypothetical protein
MGDLTAAQRLVTERWAKWFTRKNWWRRLTGRWRGPPSVPAARPLQVTWQDLGRPERPGSYTFLDGQIVIGQREIAIWRESPDGVFMVGVFRSQSGPVYYSPGTYLKPVVERPITAKITAGLRDPIGSSVILCNKVRRAYEVWKSRLP